MNREVDVRPALPAIRAPALLLCRTGEYLAEATRDMAARIPGARLVELPGRDHLPWEGDAAALLREVELFLAEL